MKASIIKTTHHSRKTIFPQRVNILSEREKRNHNQKDQKSPQSLQISIDFLQKEDNS